MTVESQQRTIASVQCLRGIAALMVVLHHLQNQTERLGLGALHLPVLQAGVDIFFVISGFIMWITTAPVPEKSGAEFIRNRIIRIVPLYWAITLSVVVVVLVAPNVLSTTVWDTEHILMSFAFLASPHPITGVYHPALIPGWTLNLEMLFYVIFALLMWIGGHDLYRRAAIILTVLSALALYGLVATPSGAAGFYSQDIIIEFAFGIVLGVVYLRGAITAPATPVLLIIAGCVGMGIVGAFPTNLPRSLEWGVPSAAIVAGAVFLRSVSLRPLEQLGDWSYSLYLSHPIVLPASLKAWQFLPEAVPDWMFPAFAVLCCVLFAAICFRLVERPLSAGAKMLMRRSLTPRGRILSPAGGH